MEFKDILQQHTDAVEQQIDALSGDVKKALEEAGFVKSVVTDLELKMARLPENLGAAQQYQTAGERFIDADEVKSFIGNASSGRKLSIDVKTITGVTGSGGDLITPYRDTTLAMPQRPLRVRDLLPTVPVSTSSVEYAAQTSRTNNAATVDEAALKPESGLEYDPVTVPIRTIAHWIIASTQVLEDAPQLRAVIDSDLLYMLGFVEDAQLLTGGGTGTDLSGIYTNATTFAAGSLVVASPQKLDVIGAAILQNAVANIPATGIVLHPADWMGICLIKDSAGNYVVGNPVSGDASDGASGTAPRQQLFGLPVVQTPAMTAGTFLVGDFRGSATLYDRMTARVEASTEDSDNFRKNLCTLRAEERIGLAVKRALGFTKGSFATAITDLTS